MWSIIGALAGWIGSKIMRTDARQGGVANVVLGIIGAVASFAVALLGACLVIGIWKAISSRRSA